MLALLKQFSEKRSAWFLLAFSSLALESTALYFQYGMGLQPCVLCVYERLAMIGLFIAGIIGLLQPRVLIIRLIALALGLFSCIKGNNVNLFQIFPRLYHFINGFHLCLARPALVMKVNGHYSG